MIIACAYAFENHEAEVRARERLKTADKNDLYQNAHSYKPACATLSKLIHTIYVIRICTVPKRVCHSCGGMTVRCRETASSGGGGGVCHYYRQTRIQRTPDTRAYVLCERRYECHVCMLNIDNCLVTVAMW